MRLRTLVLCLALCGPASAQPLQMLTEDYPPFSYSENGILKGISVDQVKEIMTAAKLDYTMELLPWARAYTLTQNTDATCVFTTGMLAERKPLFKWVQPMVLDLMIMVRRSGAPHDPSTIEEAKSYVIGVHRDDSAETYAKQQGFPHLDSAPSLEVSIKKLLSDRVDLVIMTKTTFEDLRKQGQPIEAVLDLEGTRAGIACNRAVPDLTIARMQEALDKMIADGTQAAIYRQYGQAKN